jgi:hypothetical protein
MATFETVPTEVHFQIFSYFSTATFSADPLFVSVLGDPDTAWNVIDIHPLNLLCATSKTVRNVVETYCKHRLQHLLTVRPQGKGPKTPFSSPYCGSYLQYMAGRCTFCYERVGFEKYGVVDFTIPVCGRCQAKLPPPRRIEWERAKQKYGLPIDELKANCAWSPFDETISYYQTRKTYVFDDRDIQCHIERRYGDLETFFATLEKKRWDKALESERIAKQHRWARKEIEQRITASEAMVERFIAQYEAMEKERLEEKEKMWDEMLATTERHEEMFRGWLDLFLDETAGPDGRCDQTCESDWKRRENAADRIIHKLVDQQLMIQDQIEAEEKLARDMMIQELRLYIRKQVTADVLLKHGLDSLVEPAEPKKRRRQSAVLY